VKSLVQQQRVNPYVEGAFLASITAIMGALAIYFLPVKFLVDFIWGIPIIVIIKRYNFRIGILTLITTFIITLMLTDPVTTLLMFIQLAPLAMAYGLLFKLEIPPGPALLSGSVVSIISTALTLIGFIYIAKVNIIPSEQELRAQAELVKAFYISKGLMNAEEARRFSEISVGLVRSMIPSFFAVGAIIRAFLTYILAVKVFRKLRYEVDSLPPFSEWRLPWYSVWPLIIGLGLTLTGDQFNFEIISTIGKNTLFFVIPLYFLIGLSVITYLFKNWKIPTWTKVLLGVAATVNLSGSVVLFVLIGAFDPLVSFRQWRKPKGD